ncbi:unnamed protein product [Rotaria sordida]|uniref:F5/8 type C domain-containing protein n=1 Tax=Rotaria sordida TaxID=392033 RepID=A0A813UWR9_9BILA|nr:unnamed protein product [Rotaria sordida]CAF3612244.1 unnamed protein product [Rotaria sordida]
MAHRHENQQHGQQLLNIVDRGTAEQVFVFLQKFHGRPFQSLADIIKYRGVIDDQIDFINWTGTKYNITPLMIATGKGSYEKVKILLVHGADPNRQCITGDTALNLAVHRQKYLIIELLLQYQANPNIYNQSGKTALHRAVMSYNDENAYHIRVLLDNRADPHMEDRNQRIPLDEAVIANKSGMVDILLSYDRTLVRHAYRAAIIAARLGHDNCLEVLLNYGMDPDITDRTNVTPLHVAVRSLRLFTVRLLVANGADQNIANNRGETAFAIAEHLQPDQQQNFIDALIRTPQRTSPEFYTFTTGNAISHMYPLLRSRSNWTLDSDKFRSPTADDSSVQNLLDISNDTYWCCTQSNNAWVIFDLKHEYNLTGMRIIGCEHRSTPRSGRLDVSNAFNGPWLKIIDFTCILSRNKNDFFFPPLKTRYVRVVILDNYGGMDIQIKYIGLFGVDTCLIDLLQQYNLEKSLKTLLANGINDQETLDEKRDEILNSSDKYLHVNDHFQFIRLTEALRSPRLTFLEWFNSPQTTVIAGEKLQTFSVVGDEGVTDRVKLEEKLENSPQATTTLMRDLEPTQGRSLVDFPDYTFKYPGRYKIRVVSLASPDIRTPWQEIVVGPILSYSSKLNTAAADEQLYLSSTIHLFNVTTTDKESTIRSQRTPKITLSKKDNRAFITAVYEIDNDYSYLSSLKSIKNLSHYFPLPNMLRRIVESHSNYDQERKYKPDQYAQTSNTDYYDHTTNTDYDDFDPTNSNKRQNKILTPTQYRSPNTSTRSNAFPITTTNYQRQSNDNESLGYGETIIIPTKYQLEQARINQLINDENKNRSQPDRSRYEQRKDLENSDKYIQGSLTRDKPSQYDHRNQVQQSNGLKRETSSPYDKYITLQNSDTSIQGSLPRDKPSHYNHRNQFQQLNGSEKNSADISSYNNQAPLSSSYPQIDSNRESKIQQQNPQSIQNIDQDQTESINNPYQITQANIELRPNQSNKNLYTYEPKHTQIDLILTATIGNSDVQKRTNEPIYVSNSNRSDKNSTSINNHPIHSNNISNQSSPHSSIKENYPYSSRINLIYNVNDGDLSQQSHNSSQIHTPIKYEEVPSNQTDNRHSPQSSSSSSSSKLSENKSKYFFGKNIQNQLFDDSDDDENDETECETFGHDSQIKPLTNQNIISNPNPTSILNSQHSTHKNNYSDDRFKQERDAETSTDHTLKQNQETSSNTSQSPAKKYQYDTNDNKKNEIVIDNTKQTSGNSKHNRDHDSITDDGNKNNGYTYQSTNPVFPQEPTITDTDDGSAPATDSESYHSDNNQRPLDRLVTSNPLLDPSTYAQVSGKFSGSKSRTDRKKPTEIPVRTTNGPHSYTTGIIPPRLHSASTTDITDEITERIRFDKSRTFRRTSDTYLRDSRDYNEDIEEDSNIMSKYQEQNRNYPTTTKSEFKTFKNDGTQSEQKSTRNVGTMSEPVQTSNFGNETQLQSSSTQTSDLIQQSLLNNLTPQNGKISRQQLNNYQRSSSVDSQRETRLPSPISLRPKNYSDYEQYQAQAKSHPSPTYRPPYPISPQHSPQSMIPRVLSPPFEYRSVSNEEQQDTNSSTNKHLVPLFPLSNRSRQVKDRPPRTSIETDTSLDGMKSPQHRGAQVEPSSTRESGTSTNGLVTKSLSKPRDSTNLNRILLHQDDNYILRRSDSPPSSTPKIYQLKPGLDDSSINNSIERLLNHNKPISPDYNYNFDYVKPQTNISYEEKPDIYDRHDIDELRSDSSILLPSTTVLQPDTLSRIPPQFNLLTSQKSTPSKLRHAQQQQIPSTTNSLVLNIGTENIILQPSDNEFTVPFERLYIYEPNHEFTTENEQIRSSTLKRDDSTTRNFQKTVLPVLSSSRTYVIERQSLYGSSVRQSQINGNFYLTTSPSLLSLNSSFQADDSDIHPLT